MRVLILGGSGMLGHKLWQVLAPRFDTYVTFRSEPASNARFGIFDESRSLGGLDIENSEGFACALADIRPDTVVNCIGLVKQQAAATDPIAGITVNSLFPHRLARMCRSVNARLIHLSTDCVFSGRKGNYSESDSPDASDLYGRTKLLGEVSGEGCLTIRTSMIGRELDGSHGLLEWFLSRPAGGVRGFRKAFFSGFTTPALAEVISDILSRHHDLTGIYHVAADRISKFDLLCLVRDSYRIDIDIEADESFVCDRSLDGSRFRAATGFMAPAWPAMIEQLHNDKTPYDELRGSNA